MSKRSSYRMGQEAADIVYVDAPPEYRGVLSNNIPYLSCFTDLAGLDRHRKPSSPAEWLEGYNDRMREFAACDEGDE